MLSEVLPWLREFMTCVSLERRSPQRQDPSGSSADVVEILAAASVARSGKDITYLCNPG